MRQSYDKSYDKSLLTSVPIPNSLPNSLPNTTLLSELTSRMTVLNNIKEQFVSVNSSVATPISVPDLLFALENLGIRDNEFDNLNQSIGIYADQVAQNQSIKESDRQNTINLLSQIYAIKLNDSINKLNLVAYNEYIKSKQLQTQFKP